MAVGKGGGGGAIRAGQAFVELLGKDSGLLRALDNAQKRLKAFGQTVATIGAGVAAGGAAILAPIAGLFQAAVDRGTVLDGLARQLGTTVEEVSALGYAFEASGLKQEEFIDVVKTLDQKLSQGLDGKDEAADAFRRLGLSMRDLAMATPTERLEAVGKALNGLALGADKTEFAMKLLGGQGGKTLRIFERGPGALKALTDQARDVGAVMSGETAGSAVRVSKAFTEMYAAGKYALLAIGEALLPQAAAIEEFSKGVVKTAGAIRKWIGENQGLVLGAVALGAALVAAGSALAVLGFGIAGVGVAISSLLTGILALKAAVVALVSPLGLGLAAITALGYVVVTQTEAGQALASVLTGELSTAWTAMAATAVAAWGGILSAMKRGDLAAAGEIALAGLNVAWLQGTLSLRKLWSGFTSYLGDAWATVAAGMRLVFVDVTDAIGQIFAQMIAGLLGQASNLARVLGKDTLGGELESFAAEVRRGADLDAKAADLRRKAIVKDLLADVTDRADAAGDALAGPRLALEAAKAKLVELLKAEADRAASVTSGEPGPKPPRVPAIAYAARGAFSAPDFRQVFAIGNTAAQRQLRATEQTRDAVKAVEKKLDKLAPPVFED